MHYRWKNTANKNGDGWLVVVSTSGCLILSVSTVCWRSDPHAGLTYAADALHCAGCRGSTGRLDLQDDLSHQLKGSQSTVCTRCHGSEDSKGPTSIHDRHVHRENIDCSRWQAFSRPER